MRLSATICLQLIAKLGYFVSKETATMPIENVNRTKSKVIYGQCTYSHTSIIHFQLYANFYEIDHKFIDEFIHVINRILLPSFLINICSLSKHSVSR